MKRLISPLLALALLLGIAMPASAYNLDSWNNGRFHPSAIGDGHLTICFGLTSTEGIYTNRTNLIYFLERSWGTWGYGNITFQSMGLCNNDGSNIEVLWNRSWVCKKDLLGQAPNVPGDYFQRKVYLNADCSIDGFWDWSSNGPIWSNPGVSTTDWQYSIQTVFIHEIGHALGLGHSSNTDALMASGLVDQCSALSFSQGINRDDTDGLRADYSHLAFSSNIEHAPTDAPCFH